MIEPHHQYAPVWYPDPAGRYRLRFWDGTGWTDHVSNGDQPTTDPLPAPGQPGRPTRDRSTSRPRLLTVLLALLAGAATFAIIVGGTYLVLRATGQDTAPPGWLRVVATGAAIAVAVPILQGVHRNPTRPRP